MLYFKSLLVVFIVCLVSIQPTMASQVTYHPAIPGPGGEPAWASYVFNFAAFPLGQETGFSETVGDLTITYTSPNDPSAFKTINSGDIPATPSLFPLLLGANGSSVLGISFSQSVYGIAVEYVTLGPGPIQMDLMSGGFGGNAVSTLSDSGTIPSGFIYPEGFLSLLPVCVCDNFFDAVKLSDFTDPSFAIRSIVVARQIPEPPTLALFGIGLVTLRRSNRSATIIRGSANQFLITVRNRAKN
jgi:hypothetical protein